MKKATKIWLIAAASFLAIGCVLFAGVLAATGWNIQKLSTVQTETKRVEVGEPFRDISLTTGTADIAFVRSADGLCRVECEEAEHEEYAIAVEEEALVIRLVDTRSWTDRIGFRLGSPKITVYLPKAEYRALTIRESTGAVDIPADFAFERADLTLTTGAVRFSAAAAQSLRIQASTGDIRVENASVGALALSATTGRITVSDVDCAGEASVEVSTGRAELTDLSCQRFFSNGTTGDLALDHVVAAETFSIERCTGNVEFHRCDAAELFVKTSTGHVTGSLLTGKVFLTDTRTGSVEVPKTAAGGKCEIRTVTGDIRITTGE